MLRLGAFSAKFGIPRMLGLAKLPSDVSEVLRDELLANAYNSSSIRTIADEAEALPQILVQFENLPDLRQDIPVRVISRALFEDDNEIENAWRTGQDNLSALNSDTSITYSVSTNHFLQLAEPDLIANAVRDATVRH
ncbi:hypothetical protein ACJ5NV_17630 [Loktanella agnita]|uniref:hypothetical protein n=1 Tax=Loktanella agnita TaxID=287097 RepID=UPI003989EA32